MTASAPSIADRSDAEAFLDERIGRGMKPGLEPIAGVLEFMGNPQFDYPVIHVAGTNGKTTVLRTAVALYEIADGVFATHIQHTPGLTH